MLSQRSLGAAGTGRGLPSDDLFNTVSFLSHFDGTNNGVNNVFDDISSSNHTITANGNVTQGSFGPFARPEGYWGVAFNNSDLELDGDPPFAIFDADYTMEAWVFVNAADGNYVQTTHENTNGGELNVIKITNGTDQNFLFGRTTTPLEVTTSFSDKTFDGNTWTHIAVVRSNSGTVKVYVNGVVSSTTVSMTGSAFRVTRIGGGRGLPVGSANLFNGNISNVRYSLVARYTSNFTPPTTPFSSDSDTNTLACQSNRFVDNSSNARAVTPTGTTAVSAFGPFLTDEVYDAGVNGASAYFDGTGDYLSCGSSNDFNMSDGDITWDAWVYATAENSQGGNQKIICEYYSDSANFMQIAFIGSTDIRMFLRVNNVDLNLTASNSVNLNQWHHIAVTRTSGGDWSLYIDGNRKTTGSETAAFNTSAVPFIVGLGQLSPGSRYFIGYIQNVRIVKGSIVYSGATYTVPTAPLTAVTNTKLLLNMADGQAIDSATQNNLTLFGNAKISSTQSKFGGTSLALDGTGDYAIIPNGSPAYSGDHTMEFWMYANSTGQTCAVLETRSASSGEKLSVWLSSGVVRLVSPTTNIESSTINAGQWYHIAVVRNSGTIALYIDGVSIGTGSDTTSFPVTDINIGRWFNGGYEFNGFIDDLRITEGTARYTSNFTPPTEPFADKGQ